MTTTINFINTDYNPAIEQFITSLVNKSFEKEEKVKELLVNLQIQKNSMVPWKCTIYLNAEEETLLNSESQAANYLTAFSQALVRINRLWEKNKNGIRA